MRSESAYRFALGALGLMMFAASAPSPFYPVLQERLGFSATTLTVIFAIYVVALLSTLLVVGSLSDHVGRRPVLAVAFGLLAISMLGLWWADSVAVLITARSLQGVAAAMVLSTLSAAIVDLEPVDRPGVASQHNTVVPLFGLATGAVVAGAVIDATTALDAALGWIFGGLAVLYAVLILAILRLPETSQRTPGWQRSLVPRVHVPVEARTVFIRSAPAMVACWATGGLYLSLGPAIIERELGGTSHLVQGFAIAVLMGCGAIACLLMTDWTPRRITIIGSTALAVGTALTLAALVAESLPAFLAAEVIAGAGFGSAFYGILRSLTPTVGPERRGELFAGIFVVCYLSFSIPAVIAGAVTPHAGLHTTALSYGCVVVVLAATAALLRRFTTKD